MTRFSIYSPLLSFFLVVAALNSFFLFTLLPDQQLRRRCGVKRCESVSFLSCLQPSIPSLLLFLSFFTFSFITVSDSPRALSLCFAFNSSLFPVCLFFSQRWRSFFSFSIAHRSTNTHASSSELSVPPSHPLPKALSVVTSKNVLLPFFLFLLCLICGRKRHGLFAPTHFLRPPILLFRLLPIWSDRLFSAVEKKKHLFYFCLGF